MEKYVPEFITWLVGLVMGYGINIGHDSPKQRFPEKH